MKKNLRYVKTVMLLLTTCLAPMITKAQLTAGGEVFIPILLESGAGAGLNVYGEVPVHGKYILIGHVGYSRLFPLKQQPNALMEMSPLQIGLRYMVTPSVYFQALTGAYYQHFRASFFHLEKEGEGDVFSFGIGAGVLLKQRIDLGIRIQIADKVSHFSCGAGYRFWIREK